MHSCISPILGTILYMKFPKNIRCDPSILFALAIIHNFSLAMFSIYICQGLIRYVYIHGFIFQSGYYLSNPIADRFIWLFYLSKYYEYADTFFLYLQGKTPIFLQKFHHIGAVLCWYLAYEYKLDGVVFITIANSFIHSIMYSYYFLSLFKIRWIKKYKIYLTSSQLLQLSSAFILPIVYYPPVETIFKYRILMIFNSYIFCLIGLFIHFFYKNYFFVENKK